jgi:hypothetical protein
VLFKSWTKHEVVFVQYDLLETLFCKRMPDVNNQRSGDGGVPGSDT